MGFRGVVRDDRTYGSERRALPLPFNGRVVLATPIDVPRLQIDPVLPPICTILRRFLTVLRTFCVGFAQVDIPVTSDSRKGYTRIGDFGPLIRRKPVEISRPLFA